MTPREPSEAAVERALDEYRPDWRKLRLAMREQEITWMRVALRAAYAVDQGESK